MCSEEIEVQAIEVIEEKVTLREFWIVSDYEFHQHESLWKADRERKRLAKKFPEKTFRIYHCKRRLSGSGSKQAILTLCDMIDRLLSPLGKGETYAQRIDKAKKLVAIHRGKPKIAQ